MKHPLSFLIPRSPLGLLATVGILIFGTLALMAWAFPAPPQHVLDAPAPIAYRATP